MDSDLAERRRELLRKRLAAAGLASAPSAVPRQEVTQRRTSDRGRVPLSAAQRRMWVLHRADPTGAAYNVCLHVTFSGADLNLDALRVALRALVDRHEVLRTRYPLGTDELPYQRIDRMADGFPIPLVDLRDQPEDTADRLITELAGYRFDLARDWPIRLALYRTAEHEYHLGLLVHHIAWDGGTWPVLAADLSAAYKAALNDQSLPEHPSVQYADFATAWESRAAPRDQRDYWRNQLTDLPGPIPLPADRPGPDERSGTSGGRRSLVLDDVEAAALRKLAQDAGVTAFTVLLAAFGALLHGVSGRRTDLPIGTATMSRDSAAAQHLVGNFGNTLVLRLDAGGDPSFTELLGRADHVASAGFAHQDLPYDQVVADSRDQHGVAAFNVMLLVLAQGLTGPELPGVRTSWRNVHNGTAQFDLSLEAFLIDGRAEIEATYAAELFSADRIDALLEDLRQLLAKVAANPGIRLSELPATYQATEAPVVEPAQNPRVAPDDAICRIRAIMAELLETDTLAEDADFFASGGNSLLSTRLVARVRDELGSDISVRTIAEQRTPERIAAAASTTSHSATWRTVTPSDDEARPLSVTQHALWFLYESNGPTPDYNVAYTRRLTGQLDIAALRLSLVDLLDRHEALRTVIRTVDDVPQQVVLDTHAALFAGAELCVRATEDVDRDLTAALEYAFHVESEPAFHPILFQLGENDAVLLILTHHLFADEWSETLLWKDLARAYRARMSAATPKWDALPVTYSDYALWQRSALSGPELSEQRAFWRTTLADLPEQLDLPTDYSYAPDLPTDGDAVTVELPRSVMAGLRALAQQADTTPFVVWHGIVVLLLHRNGAGTDLPVGTPVTGRGTTELDGVVGMFVNSVVLRADLSGNPTFSELIRRLAATDLAAFANQDLPFERVVDLIDPPRVLGRNPLFQTMVVYADATPARFAIPAVTDEPLAARLQTAKFDLSITLTDDTTAPPTATVRYRTALFDPSTAQRLADELTQLAAEVAAEPDRPLARIDHLRPAERVRLLETWNATAAPISSTTLPEMLTKQAAATPDAVAVVCGDDELTYSELAERVGRLAAELVADGVGAECVVGVHLDRSIELVVAVLAIQHAGGAFVPLEPSWPVRRVEDTLRTSRPVLVISHDADALPDLDVPVRTVAVTRDLPIPAPATPDPENLAYVMFTSGSTGTPKGAMIRHRAIANRLLWQRDLLGFGPGDAALFKAPMGFDISVNELFLPLMCGAKLVIAPPGQEREVDALAELIAVQQVTFCYLTSSMLALLLDSGPAERLACLRHVWCGGELLTSALFARFREAIDATMYHGYGPAEATIGVSHEIYRAGHDERGAVTIGRPNPNTAIYLLDEWLRPVSVGVPGELYIGGLLLGRGYVGDPRRTAERWVANPFGEAAGERLYRTGDLARRRADGVLEFLGRSDNQIKIRGMRVEPEEIEATLVRHPAVRHAAVRTHEGVGGKSLRLVGYQVAAGAPLGESELRAWLAERLPAHMVPERILTLDALPMLPSGKVNRAALPAPVADTARTTSRPPNGPDETRVAVLFAQVLGLPEIGAEDDFFSLGGDSILSIRLVSAARAAGLRFTVRDVFTAPTVAALAPRVSVIEDTAPTTVTIQGSELPLSPLQHGLLFQSLADETEADAYIAQLAITLTGDVSADRLRTAVDAVLRRHGSLRAAFHHVGRAEPVQVIADDVRVPWTEVDLSGEPDERRDQRWRELRDRERVTRFALDQAPLLRATLVRFSADEHRLLLTNHHLLFDGWSLPLLVNDLLAAYADDVALPPATGDYAQYLDWLGTRDRDAAEQAWRTALDGVTGPTMLAEGREVAYQPSVEHRLNLGRDLTSRLTALARESSVTAHTVLLTAWGLLLGQLTAGTGDVLFGSTVSGRPAELPGAESTVGLFINTVPARVTSRPSMSFTRALRETHTAQVDLLDHQHLGLAAIQRSVGLGELFDTLLVFESYPVSRDALDAIAARAGLAISGLDSRDDTHYPLTVLVAPGDNLGITLKYRPGIFDADWISLLGDRLRALLTWCTDHPETPLARLDPLLPGETSSWAAPTTAPAEDLLAGFDRSVSAWPAKVALRFEDEALTYAELAARVTQLAAVLQERGAGPEAFVGISFRRSSELIISVLATLRAGAAFLPLDPDQPAARLRTMLDEAAPVTVLDAIDQDPAAGFVPTHVDPESPAYLIYTSGSTGVPKGAVLTRAGLHNRLSWMAAHFGISSDDVIVQKTPIGFDVSVWELVLPFLVGAELVIARPDGHRDPAYLAELIRSRRATTVHFVPSMLRAFLADPSAAHCSSLRRILCSGEELPTELAQRCTELLAAEVHNLYGPTEASIDVTAARCAGHAGGSGVPIGRAIDGVYVRVLDAALRPVPPGVPGELYLGGVQLARGYHGRAALTASRFVADPRGNGERLYRTGDVVRADPDGTLVYLGRDDDQVKIRGVRVEPGESARVLADLPEVAEAVVVPRTDGPSGTWLVAYVVPAAPGVDPEALRAAVADVLPDQFVPGAFVLLDRLPTTGSGKLDRRALPAPDRPVDTSTRRPSGPVEAKLCALFAEVLGLDSISPDGNFFALGGDSISALRLTSQARTAGLTITPRQVFEAKTPAAIAKVATGRVVTSQGTVGVGDIPLTPIMYRLVDRGGPIGSFSQSVVLRTPAELTESELTAGLRAVLATHDVLRARLVRADEPWLRVDQAAESDDVPLRRIEGVVDDSQWAGIAEAAARELDPEAGRMVAAVWSPGRLLLVAHHLVVDGVSWRILIEDLAAACQGAPIEPTGTSFRAWSFALRRQAPAIAAELPVWRKTLAGPPSKLVRRPMDPTRDVLGATERIEVRAPADLTKAVLTTLPQALRAQTQEVLLAALVVALAHVGETSPVLRLEGHGREEDLVGDVVDLTRTVGWFTTAFPVRLDATSFDPAEALAGGASGGTLVKRVRETLRALPNRGAGYGVLRHLLPRTSAELGELPEPVIGFNYLGRFDARSESGDWTLVPGTLAGGGDPDLPVAHALDVNVLIDDEGLRASWTHLPEHISALQARHIADTWLTALHGLARYAERPDAAAPAAEDFDLVRVSTTQLDRLRARFGG